MAERQRPSSPVLMASHICWKAYASQHPSHLQHQKQSLHTLPTYQKYTTNNKSTNWFSYWRGDLSHLLETHYHYSQQQHGYSDQQ